MRPDIDWPRDVQAVMDRALEREAPRRYQAATEFGRDLVRAIDAMGDGAPGTSTEPARLEDGRSCNSGSRPATLTPRSVPTVAVATPPRQASLPTTPPPNRRNVLVPVAGGIAVLLVVSAALYKPILGRTKRSPAADTSSPPSAPSRIRPSKTALPSPDTSQVAGPAQRQPGRSSTSVPASQTPTIDIAKELSKAEAESNRDDEGSARAALHRIETIEGRLDATTDIVRAGMASVNAWLTLKDATKSLRRAEQCQGPRFGYFLPGQSGRPTPCLLIIPRIRSCQFPTPPPPR